MTTTDATPQPPSVPMASIAAAAPVTETGRIESIDVLRGFALLGVLLMNMQAFAMPFSAYMNPTSYGNNDAVNFALWCVNHVLADGKFITIFSMLFGAGVVLMTTRARERTGKSAWLHYRRMLWLMLFGVLHGVLLWYGDILFLYGVCGLLIYLLRRLRPLLLLIIAGVLFCVTGLFLLGMESFVGKMSAKDLAGIKQMWSPTAEWLAGQEEAYRGSYMVHLSERAKAWASMLPMLVFFGWRIAANMLIGMALFKTGVLSAARSKRLYIGFIVVGFGVGVPMVAFGVHRQVSSEWDMVAGMGIGAVFNYVGSMIVAFGWIGVVMLMCQSGWLTGLQRRLAAVGRMAFTNYIMHSVICTTIFYGHGLGYFGKVDRTGQLLIVVLIAAFQLLYSPLWLRRFRFGPLEWLWRTLTYWRRTPFARA